jgi:hypothetical protein
MRRHRHTDAPLPVTDAPLPVTDAPLPVSQPVAQPARLFADSSLGAWRFLQPYS